MAYRDGTGPEGMGPLTGRGLGNCPKEGVNTTSAVYYGGNGMGRRGGGRGLARGCRPGFGRTYYQPVDRQVDLNAEKEMLKRRLAEIEGLTEKNE